MNSISPEQICFGLNEDLDRKSFCCFLQLIGRPEAAEMLSSRLSSAEIDAFVADFTDLMKKHFTNNEYHTIFQLKQHHTNQLQNDKD